MLLAFALVASVALASLGCQATPSGAPASAPAVTAAAPTASTTAGPIPTGGASGTAVLELPEMNAIVPGGRYTVSSFRPAVSFDLENDVWRVGPKIEGFFALVRSANGDGAIIVRFVRPTAINSGPDTTVDATTAAAAISTLEGNTTLAVKGTSDSLMSGLSGKVIELEGAGTAAGTPSFMVLNGIKFVVEPGGRVWIAFFDLPDGLLAIQVLGSSAAWERDLGLVEPFLESVTIGS
jgi:hypothetical protein